MKKNNRILNNIILIISGIIVNYVLAQITLLCELPLFLDSIGTIVVASLGGYIPGIIVGFFSNAINSLTDSITLYYGVLSVFIAIVASFISKKFYFRKPWKALLSVLYFSFIGGCLGSVITWLLYGFNFGSGISAEFAIFLNEQIGLGKFISQFTADILIDLLDKFVTVTLVYFILNSLLIKVTGIFDFGYIYQKENIEDTKKRVEIEDQKKKSQYKRYSLSNKIIFQIVTTAIILTSFGTAISTIIYNEKIKDIYIEECNSIVDLISLEIDNKDINEYLIDNIESEKYLATEKRLESIRDSNLTIKYLYVYQIKEDGCHVVFDIDTPDLLGASLGDVIPFDESFLDYKDDLLAGKEIKPIITNDSYGWLLTVYKPLYYENKCVAYAAADIGMEDIVRDRAIFVVRMVSVLFGATIIIIGLSIEYSTRRIVMPINEMTECASSFAFNDENRQKELVELEKKEIKTGDEIENLYSSFVKMAFDVEHYIEKVKEDANTISQMQSNIILSFAIMVENRDENTGLHIKKTALYVKVICEYLKYNPKYADILTDEYIDNLYRSAPLHDTGKIRISDTILNKPGKLTPEEYAIMRTHTLAGKEILMKALEGIEGEFYLKEAINVCTYHHEKWNGTGYPEGLVGEQIPIGARIMAVADVFDALVSKRSYKEAYEFDTAVDIIKESSGSHFDPDIVEAFQEGIEDVKKIVLLNK